MGIQLHSHRCEHCGSRNIYFDEDEAACLICGWRPSRAPTKEDKRMASVGGAKEPSYYRMSDEERDTWKRIWAEAGKSW